MSEVFGYLANLNRGILLTQHGRFQEASVHFGHAIEAEPDNPQTYYQQAICYNNWGKVREALRYLDRGQKLAPIDPDFLILRAWILSGHALFSWRALSLVNKALEMDPMRPTAFITKARIYRVGGYWRQSEAAAREALRLEPRNDYAANLLALALREQGRTSESNAVIQQILQRVPNDAFGHANAGWTALQSGEQERAYCHFLEALRIDPHESLAIAGIPHALIQRSWIYRLRFRASALYTRQNFAVRMLTLFVILGSPIFIIPTVSIELSPTHFNIGINVVMTLIATGMMFFAAQRLGRIAILSHPLQQSFIRPIDRVRAVFDCVPFVPILFLMFLLNAWVAPLVFVALTISHFYSIRRPEIETEENYA